MDFIICKDYAAVSAKATTLFVEQINRKADSVLGLATGSTPLGLYEGMAKANAEGQVDFSKVTTFNLDEYYPIEGTHHQSYRYFMNKNLFTRINIPMESTHVPNGQGDQNTGRDYDRMIQQAGGIDLQLLGVGHNGHIGFNEPDAALVAGTHITELTQRTIQANARFFETEEDVPKQAITMGMATILKAKAIVCLITGKDKHPVVERLLDDTIDPMCPATFLKLHDQVTILCDEEAYKG
ncbi:MAG: glucosamine-6-phosphate deaminase [Clostridia bacterium]|nr:glucosamine-6-phosphate deaminase [Clostridia bacterium]